MKLFLALLFLVSSLLVRAADPSSEIPLKRNYPVNESLNPCENLYEYACSKTIESFKLRPDRRKHTFAFNDSMERILEFKKKTLKELTSAPAENKMAEQLKNYYLSCVNKEARAKEESDYISKKIEEVENIKSKNEWLALEAKKIHSGKVGFINYSAVDNFDDPRKSDVIFGVGYSLLPEKSYAKNPELMKAFEALVKNYFETIKISNPADRAQVVIKYETEQQENRFFPAEAREAYSQRNYTTKADILKSYPELEMKQFLDLLPVNIKIRNFNPKTFPFLSSVAQKYSLEDLKTLQLFYEMYSKLDKGYPSFYEEFFAFRNKFLGGKNKRSELEEECTEITMSHFGAELDYWVIGKMFPHFSSKKVAELVEKIKESILASLAKNTWLSKEAKKEAQRKMTKAYMRLVAPATYEDWKFLPEADYASDSYIANGEKRNNLEEEREFKYFREIKNIRSWEGVEPLQVNAFYQPAYNQFTMLQGVLQYPFYDQENSLIENLAGVGMVVGHELGHGIDDQGSKYDADGKLKSWMKPKDLAKFKDLTKSLVDQYTKAGMNGVLTLGENIGDFVGLTAAYDAAFVNSKLSSEDLKKEQKKFFLSYARSWCEVQLPGVRELRLKTDPHSLGVARVNELVKHFDGFQNAFECKASDPMVLPADKKVHIW
jgi:putative endopeptidase